MRVDGIADRSSYSATIGVLRAMNDLETKPATIGDSPVEPSAIAVKKSVDEWRSAQSTVVADLATSFEVDKWVTVDGISVARPSVVPARPVARTFVASMARLADFWMLGRLPDGVVKLLSPEDLDVLSFAKDLRRNEALRKNRHPFVSGYVSRYDSWEEAESVLGFVMAGLTIPWYWKFAAADRSSWVGGMLTRLGGRKGTGPAFTRDWCAEFHESGVARLTELEGGLLE